MNELGKALISNSAFAAPRTILEAIPGEIAHARPVLVPHSIYEEVWHMAFWQRITLDWVEGRATPYPEHAAEGFPGNATEGWQDVCRRFLAGTQNAAAVASDGERLEVVVACPRVGDAERVMTVREQLESLAAHNAYHLGRVVLLRQLLGVWPPPGGGDTW
jgi:uncharacterized damage-inducible protein DinB